MKTKQGFTKEMQEHQKEFDEFWRKVVKTINDYKEDRGKIDWQYDPAYKNIEHFADQLAASGGWIYDRMNDVNGLTDKKSTTKKIRKALGFNE